MYRRNNDPTSPDFQLLSEPQSWAVRTVLDIYGAGLRKGVASARVDIPTEGEESGIYVKDD